MFFCLIFQALLLRSVRRQFLRASHLHLIADGAIAWLSGDGFDPIIPIETHTNHDHEELMESIEVLSVRMTRAL